MIVKAISARPQFLVSRMPATRKNSRNWLSRLRVSVTTVAKLSVSEVTRLTIFPDENSSKNDISRSMTAPKASLRNCNTTSPTARAVYHWRNILQVHESTAASRIKPTSQSTGCKALEMTSVSRLREIKSGKAVSSSELNMISPATKSIVFTCGRK